MTIYRKTVGTSEEVNPRTKQREHGTSARRADARLATAAQQASALLAAEQQSRQLLTGNSVVARSVTTHPSSRSDFSQSPWYWMISWFIRLFGGSSPTTGNPLQNPFIPDGRKFITLDTNRDLVISGTRGDDDMQIQRDAQTGDYFVAINGDKVWIRADDLNQARAIVVHGNEGNDRLDFSALGDAANKLVLYGDEGDDTLIGSSGNDRIVAGSGRDVVQAGGGDDQIDVSGDWKGGRGYIHDQVDAGTGNDTVHSDGQDKIENAETDIHP